MEFTVSKSRSGTRTESVAGRGGEEDHHPDSCPMCCWKLRVIASP